MHSVTITTALGTVRATSMTKDVLSTIAPIFPLQQSIIGVQVIRGQEYYCHQHQTSAPNLAAGAGAKITLDEARREVAWCKQCRSVLYLNPNDPEWETLRDRLCPDGDYSRIEIYKSLEWDKGTYSVISFHRLVPGALEVEVMFPHGAFDYKDAYRDRREQWPNTLPVDATVFDQELAKRASLLGEPRSCCGYVEEQQQGWQLCGEAMATTCSQCHRPICEEHQEHFTYSGDKESVVICSPCRQEIHLAYGK